MPEASTLTFRFIAGYILWWLACIGVQTFMLTQLGWTFKNSLIDSAVTDVTLAFSGYTINTTLRFFQPRKIVRYAASWIIALAVLAAFLQQWILEYLRKGDEPYLEILHKSLLIRGGFDWIMLAFITMISWMYFYVIGQKEADKRREDAERLAREAELSDLRTQLQPHFLFNSLNSISALIGSQPGQARTMIQQLSDFLRGTVRKDSKQLVTFEEELRHLQLYLAIEKIRFGHRLDTIITHGDGTMAAQLPSLLLQPIVENAIKFGLYDTIGQITITIDARIENGDLVVEIRNPFDASTSQPKGTGFGLSSIRRRLYLTYLQNDLLDANHDGAVFSTKVKIPQ